MKNFDWEIFSKRIAVKSDLPTMYNAWAKSEEIEKWFLSHCDFVSPSGELLSKNQPCAQNDTYAWAWYLFDVVEHGKIVLANGIDTIQFTFAGNCLVEVKLEQLDDHIIVSLTQSKIPTDEDSKRNIRIGCADGWAFYLVNLKSLYEGGLDLRNKDNRYQGVVNS